LAHIKRYKMNFSDWASVLGAFILVIVVGLVLFCIEQKSSSNANGLSPVYYWSFVAMGVLGGVLSIVGSITKFTGESEAPVVALRARNL
jgi:hypothetical protein